MSFATGFDIEVRSEKAARGVEEITRLLDNLDRRATETGRKLDDVFGKRSSEVTLRDAARKADELGRGYSKAADSADRLARETRDVARETQNLARAQAQLRVAGAGGTAAVPIIARRGGAAAVPVAVGAGAGGLAGRLGPAATGPDPRISLAELRARATSQIGTAEAAGIGAATAGLSKFRISALGATAAIGGTAAALVIGAKSASRFAQDLNRSAQQIGINVEALQELRFAGDQYGVTQQQIDAALEAFSGRAFEASQGARASAEAFKSLGVSVVNSSGELRATDAILGDVTNALSSIEDPAKRSEAAIKLFTKSGEVFGIMANDLRSLRAQAQQTGSVLSQDLVQQGVELDRKFREASDAIGTRFKTALIAISPAINLALEGLIALSSKVGEIIDRFRDLNNLSANRLAERLSEVNRGLQAIEKAGGGPRVRAFANFRFANREQLLTEQAQILEAMRNFAPTETPTATRIPRPRRTGGTDGFSQQDRLLDQLTQSRIQAERELTNLTLSEEDRRRAVISQNFQDLLVLTRTNAQARAEAERIFSAEVAALDFELARDREEAQRELSRSLLSEYDRQVLDLERSLQQQLEIAGTNEELRTQIHKQGIEERRRLDADTALGREITRSDIFEQAGIPVDRNRLESIVFQRTLNEAIAEGALTTHEAEQAMAAFQNRLNQPFAVGFLESIGTLEENLRSLGGTVAQTTTDALIRMMREPQSAGQALLQLVDEITLAIVRMAIQQQLAGLISGAFGLAGGPAAGAARPAGGAASFAGAGPLNPTIFHQGGVTPRQGGEIAATLHSNELVAPLTERRTLAVAMGTSGPEVRTPGGDVVPVEFQHARAFQFGGTTSLPLPPIQQSIRPIERRVEAHSTLSVSFSPGSIVIQAGDLDSFKRAENQVQATLARALERAERRRR